MKGANTKKRAKDTTAKVSVIITTKNSAEFIIPCIKAVKNSTYKNIEIIVVDNFSTDLTPSLASENGAKVYKKGNERSAQRNYGVKKSKGEYVLILDVDMTISKDLIAECLFLMGECGIYTGLMNTEPFDALYIPERIIGEGFWIKVRDFERSFYNGTRIDAIRFIKKSCWIDYDTELCGAEDWDHDRRFIGKKCITANELYHNEGTFSFKRYAQKKGYYCQWMKKYKERYGNCLELNPLYRYCGVFLEKGKWRKSLRHPILLLCVIFLKLIIGVKYLTVKKVK